MKRCSVCRLDLPRAAFDPNPKTVTGLRSECRECGRKRSREAMRRRWAEQPEKMVESNNRSYAKHRDKRIATRRAYHASHREEAKVYQKAYSKANWEREVGTPELQPKAPAILGQLRTFGNVAVT